MIIKEGKTFKGGVNKLSGEPKPDIRPSPASSPKSSIPILIGIIEDMGSLLETIAILPSTPQSVVDEINKVLIK